MLNRYPLISLGGGSYKSSSLHTEVCSSFCACASSAACYILLMRPELANPQAACAPQSSRQSLSSIVDVRSAGGDMAGMARPGVKPGGGGADPAVAAMVAQVAQVAASSSPRRRK